MWGHSGRSNPHCLVAEKLIGVLAYVAPALANWPEFQRRSQSLMIRPRQFLQCIENMEVNRRDGKMMEPAHRDNIVKLVTGGPAVLEAARGLELILENHPKLALRVGTTQVSVWRHIDAGWLRVLRLQLHSSKADLLIHEEILSRHVVRLTKDFDLSRRDRDREKVFLRFCGDAVEKTRELMVFLNGMNF